MPNSWGHAISLLPRGAPQRRHPCAAPVCDQLATHLSVYNYITGKAGRASWAARGVCDLHAERFRAKHQLPEPEVAPAPRHALERLIGGDA
jgi:hypothetical protein